MKTSFCIAAGVFMAASAALAAGSAKKLRLTVDETTLQGYVATPPAGWAPSIFSYGAATPVGASTPAIYAISNQVPAAFLGPVDPPTAPPPPAGVTLLSHSNFILAKENFPRAVQVVASDCNLYNKPNVYNVCPYLRTVVRPSAALPGRLLFLIFKTGMGSTGSTELKYWEYIFDPSGVGAARWVLAQTGLSLPDLANLARDEYFSSIQTNASKITDLNIIGQTFRVADVNWYLLNRTTRTLMQVYQITPK